MTDKKVVQLARPSGLTPALNDRWSKFHDALWEMIHHPELGNIPAALLVYELELAKAAVLADILSCGFEEEEEGTDE